MIGRGVMVGVVGTDSPEDGRVNGTKLVPPAGGN